MYLLFIYFLPVRDLLAYTQYFSTYSFDTQYNALMIEMCEEGPVSSGEFGLCGVKPFDYINQLRKTGSDFICARNGGVYKETNNISLIQCTHSVGEMIYRPATDLKLRIAVNWRH